MVFRDLHKILFILLLSLILTWLLRGGDGLLKGSDSIVYLNMFDKIKEYDSLSSIYYMNDYFFSNYSFLIKKFTQDSKSYLSIIFLSSTLIILTAYFLFLKNYNSSYFYLSVFLLLSTSTYYLYNLNALRQGLSASTLMLGLAIMYQYKSYLTSFMIIIIGTLLHKSGVIFVFIFVLIEFFKLKLDKSLYFFFICLFTGFVTQDIFLKTSIFFDLNYFIYKFSGLSKSVTGNTSVLVKVFVLTTVLVTFHFLSRYNNRNNLYSYLLTYYTYYAAFIMLFSSFESMFNRFLMFPNIFEPILFTLAITIFKQKKPIFIIVLYFSLGYMVFMFNYPSIVSELRL